MRKSIVSMASAALFAASGVSAQSNIIQGSSAITKAEPLVAEQVDRIKVTNTQKNKDVFNPIKGLTGTQRYIVRFEEEPLASYTGTIPGFPPTSLTSKQQSGNFVGKKLNTKSVESVAYLNYLEKRQSVVESAMTQKLSRPLNVEHWYKAAINGAALRMTQDEAAQLATVPGIASIELDREEFMHTDRGPTHIGAPELWNGAVNNIDALGQGMVIGILDSGIHGDHPSFAAVDRNGYEHVNPLGEGNFLGECDVNSERFNPEVACNSKLIGRYLFIDATPTEDSSEDTDGHGSHVASTAGGNFVSAPFNDAEGNPTGANLDISGVAPHANIIAFQVCAPSCFGSDRVAAVDQAILDGQVDVLNHSIGSNTPVTINPWTDAVSQAFLSARAAGITVANSMGNNGPNPSTLGSSGAPWVTNVGSFTHDREFQAKEINTFTGGDTTPPGEITGRAITDGYGPGPIVYAGDFDNGDPNPEQCLTPFPEGTWTNGEIVVCDRGEIARTQKCINIRDGGAAACVLTNVDGGAASIADDAHVIPAIHIAAEDGNAIKDWLATGTDHSAVIEGGLSEPTSNSALANIAANSTSRGPHLGQDYQPVSVGAPGVSIYAAQADGVEFGFLSGTSMASPHVAGASTLLKQVHPDWTDAEVLSALATTATTAAFQEDGTTPATPFDVGGGVIRVDRAATAGLLLDETVANFEAANPALGGDPTSLNVSGMVTRTCVLSCSWERTFEATQAGTWTVTTTDSGITATPSEFTLAAGETQTVTVNVDATQFPLDEWTHGRIDLTPDGTLPTQHLTLSFTPVGGEIPELVDIVASRSSDSFLITGIESAPSSNLQVLVNGLTKPTSTQLSLEGDSDVSSAFDDLTDGVGFELLDVSESVTRIVASTTDALSESPDVDLFLGFDSNGDGLPSQDEVVCSSATFSAQESCDVVNPDSGEWWVLVQNYTASSNGTDAITLDTTLVSSNESNMTVNVPGAVAALTPYDMRVGWSLEDFEQGDVVHGTVTLGTNASNPGNIGTIPVTITRGADDVEYSVSSNPALEGNTLTFTVSVATNETPEDRNYSLEATVPEGFTLVPESVTGDGVVSGDSITWNVTQESTLNAQPGYNVTTSDETAQCAVPFANSGGYVNLEAFGILPSATITGDSIQASAFGGQNFNFYGEEFTGNFLLTDDGFITFGTSVGETPFANQSIPSATLPNEFVAALWRDLVIPEPNRTPGSLVGVTLASAGPNLSIVEYDNVKAFPGDGEDSIDFEIAIRGTVDDSPGAYEIFIAFDNIVNGSSTGTIGVENATGTAGTQYAFNDVAVTDGMAICFDLVGPVFEDVELSFQVTVDESTAGTVIESQLSNDVDSIGTETVTETEAVVIAVRGDYDSDGDVDINDVRSMMLDIQNNKDISLFYDLNDDGVVNVLDARAMMSICTRDRCAP